MDLELYQSSTTSASSGFGNYIAFCFIAGHYGTNYAGSNWTNVPFRWIDDTPAKNGLTASRWYGSDTHVNNSINTGKLIIHDTYPNIGAVTRYYGQLIKAHY